MERGVRSRRLVGALALVAVLVVGACGGGEPADGAAPGAASSGGPSAVESASGGPSAAAPSTGSAVPTTSGPPAPPPPLQLPRGGTTIFPQSRVVAHYGTAYSAALGVLGEGTPDEAALAIERSAAAFATPDRAVQPAMELIVTVADRTPGADGSYSHRIDPGPVREYLAAARRQRQLLVLDVQPGRSDFLTEVRAWEELLVEPDVGLALDPEWRMPPGEVPGGSIGTVDAAEVNAVVDWLVGLVRSRGLPQKLLLLHGFTGSMITNLPAVATPPELAVVQHLDGFGTPGQKLEKYTGLQRPDRFHMGFKLFLDEDTPLLTPAETLALVPPPEFISYQ